MGSIDECYNVKSEVINSTGRTITGKYCMSHINTTENTIIGYCVPSTCNRTNAYVLIKPLMQQEKLNFDIYRTVCNENQKLSKGAIVSIIVTSLIAALVVFGSFLQCIIIAKEQLLTSEETSDCRASISSKFNLLAFFHRFKDKTSHEMNERTELVADTNNSIKSLDIDTEPPAPTPSSQCRTFITQFLLSFSLITNTKKFLSTRQSSGPLACLNGMKVLSLWWVILIHTYMYAQDSKVFYNPSDDNDIRKRFTFRALQLPFFCVDTFFFISGLLVTYLCLSNLVAKDGKINWGLFYFHRFWRLTPVYAFVLMIWGSLVVYTLNGPGGIVFRNDKKSMQIIDICSTTWWANLLYLNNFYPHLGDLQNQCMPWTWYLANDMQFYVISPLIIILMYRYKRAAVAVCAFLIVGCIVSIAVSVWYYGFLIPSYEPTKHIHEPLAIHDPLYNKPYTRIAPYIVGMLVGMLLHAKAFKLTLPKLTTLLGWCAAIAIGLSVVYGQYYYFADLPRTRDASLSTSVFYLSLSRFLWSVVLAWIVIACTTGKGGPVTLILSWNVWEPLGRLNYCAYLIHPILIQIYLFNLHNSLHYTDFVMVYIYFGNVVFTYLVAYLISTTVEVPLLGLEKLILGDRR